MSSKHKYVADIAGGHHMEPTNIGERVAVCGLVVNSHACWAICRAWAVECCHWSVPGLPCEARRSSVSSLCWCVYSWGYQVCVV